MSLEGELTLNMGVDVTIGVGTKNDFGAGKAGFALRVDPVAATAGAKAGSNSCASIALGAAINLAARLEVWVVRPEWGVDERFPLIGTDIAYPGAGWSVGDCG